MRIKTYNKRKKKHNNFIKQQSMTSKLVKNCLPKWMKKTAFNGDDYRKLEEEDYCISVSIIHDIKSEEDQILVEFRDK